jgi:hypothetical protein
MKLHEEFKLYENMWESVETSAVVFVGNRHNENTLLDKVAKTNSANITTVFSTQDFLRQYQNANKEFVKFYTDKEGMAELEKSCADMPANMKNKILNSAVLVEAAGSRTVDWNRQEDWHLHNAPDEAYALMAVSDDSAARNVFISWMSPDYDGYFGAVDNFDDIELYTFYETVADAEDAADGAYNQAEYGFFQGPISIIKISNFRQAYFGHGVAPKYTVVKTV